MFAHEAFKKSRVHPSCVLTTVTSAPLRAKRHKLHENRDHPKTSSPLVASPFVVAGMNVLNDRYWIGHDPSDASCLPWHWMIVRRVSEPTMRQWRKGEVVVISASRMAPYVKNGTPLGKFISATAGDHVAIRSDGIFVNGDATPVGYLHADAIRRADAHLKAETVGDDERAIPDRRVESFYREIVVGDGELFILGATPRSQDSRYFGVQRVENIRGVVVAPLW